MIRTQELTVVYDRDNLVLDRVSVTIETGKIVGIIGPNGAGKSTLMNNLIGQKIAITSKKPQTITTTNMKSTEEFTHNRPMEVSQQRIKMVNREK